MSLRCRYRINKIIIPYSTALRLFALSNYKMTVLILLVDTSQPDEDDVQGNAVQQFLKYRHNQTVNYSCVNVEPNEVQSFMHMHQYKHDTCRIKTTAMRAQISIRCLREPIYIYIINVIYVLGEGVKRVMYF